MYELSVKSKFSSAHFLREYEGKCEHLHGHNWKVEAIVRGEELNNIGLLIDFKILKKTLVDVLEDLDHKLINDIDYFKTNNPSCEHIAAFLYKKLAEKLNDERVTVYKIIVWETDDACVGYSE